MIGGRAPVAGSFDAMEPGPLPAPSVSAGSRRPPRPWARRALLTVNVLVAVCLVATGAVYGYVRYRNSQITRIPGLSLPSAAAGSPVTILLVGSNTRTGLDPAEVKQFGSATEVGGARSDVTMLVRLDPATRSITLLSIPRDLWIPIPGTDRQQRVDAALNNGPSHLLDTIQADLGIPINHYVELNFDTFQSVVNTLGGLDMYFPAPVRDGPSGLNLGTGCLHLNGTVALAVVRARHLQYEQNGRFRDDPFGDLSRIRRNHEFLRVLARAVQQQGVDNPLTVNALAGAVAPKLKVDDGLSLSTMVDLARRFRGVDPSSVPTTTLPVVPAPGYVYRGVSYGDVVLPDQPQDQQVINQFLGSSAPTAMPAGGPPTVQVVNQSGVAVAGARVANGLRASGFAVSETTTGTVAARPAESVIVYASGQEAAALRVQSMLSGPVSLGLGTPPPGSDLVLDVGTGLIVTPGGAAATSTTTTAVAAPGRGPSTSTTSAPAGVVVSGSAVTVQQTPQPYDPTACPPGIKGR